MNNYSDLSNAFGDNIEAAIRHYIVSGYEGRTDATITATNNLTNDTNNSSQTTLNEVGLYLSDLEALNYIACNEDQSLHLERI